MAMTIGKLRMLLVAAVVALIAVIGGYVWYGRMRLVNFGEGLAQKAGLEITTDGFKYSHALGADTQFTLRASRQIKHEDGKMTLHDVGIVVYGAKADRSDRISGSQFEYDPKSGVLTGVGEVFIDLQAPAAEEDKGAFAKKSKPDGLKTTAPKTVDESKVIHVKTRGLVFLEKEKSASTEDRVDFVVGEMTGNSVGASYDSQKGIVVLKSAVHLSGLRDEHPVAVSAARAEMDRDGHVAKLEAAKAVFESDEGARTMAADHAVIHARVDGSLERVDGAGHVVLTGDGHGGSHGIATGDRMQVDLNEKGQAQRGFLTGNVRLVNDGPGRHEDGRGQDVHMAFDAEGRPVHSVATGDVELHVTETAGDRLLNATKLDLDLGGGGKAPVYVKGAVASAADGARLRLVDKVKGGGTKTTVMRGDTLVARFGTAPAALVKKGKSGVGPPLVGLDGKGKTFVEQTLVDAKGVQQSKQTSTGETLKADFHTGDGGKTELSRAEQRGAVAMRREVIAKPKAATAAAKASAPKTAAPDGPEIEHAKADAVVYEAESEVVTLTGDVQIQDSESALYADKVVSEHTSGVSTAEGGVRVSYLQQGSTEEPMHVLAARAVSHKDSGISEFFAGAGGRAKMWQGGSQVEAPVLDFDRVKKTVVAKDVAGSHGVVVKSVIVDSKPLDAVKTEATKASTKKQGSKGPMRVLSEEMIYTDAARLVEFKGKVRADDADGVMHADDALVYLTPADKSNKDAPVELGGRVDHMVAEGAVVLDQPGRKATGEKLTYAASDETFVLTGTKAAPPKMVDEQQGMTTGAALRFRTGDDSVVVSGGVSTGDDAGKVRSETRMKPGQGKKP
jgi:lipopolysaccharide export system protein LptA